jgi:hypothetical protein
LAALLEHHLLRHRNQVMTGMTMKMKIKIKMIVMRTMEGLPNDCQSGVPGYHRAT